MILLKTVRFIQVFTYIIVAGQLLFYMVTFNDVMKLITIEDFLELRKITDSVIVGRNRFLYLTCLFANIGVLLFVIKKPSSVLFITSAIAILCLVLDILLALKGNGPLNTMVNSGTLSGMNSWETVRIQWLDLIFYRGVLTAVGLISLLIGLLWQARSN